MAIVMPEERQYELVPAGTHVATCRLVVDLGTQEGQYGEKRQILFGWELPEELTERGEPFGIYRRYTYTSDRRSALRTDIESWLGRGLTSNDFGKLDLAEMLGRSCLLGVKHENREGRNFANITSVMLPPRGTPERRSVIGDAISLSLDDRPFRKHEFEALPQWIRELIQKSPEYAKACGHRPVAAAASTTAERLRSHLAAPSPAKGERQPNDLDDAVPF